MAFLYNNSIKVTWKLFTFSLFILTICSKLPFLPREVLWIPKAQNLYILMGLDGNVLSQFQFSDLQSVFFRCAINPLPISTSTSLSFYSCFFDDLRLLLWWFTTAFTMIYSYFYNEVVQYRLNPHGYCLDFVSDVDCNIFLPRIQNFQARKILVSSRENFMLDTRIHFIPYENEVYSSKEWSVFS